MMNKDQPAEPMDKTMPESKGDGVMHVNHPRKPYAMGQLIEEVTALFPEATYETSNTNPRNVDFDVQFDFTMLGDDAGDAAMMLSLLNDPAYVVEPRITNVVVDPEIGVLVSFRNDPRVMDLRDPFGLADAWIVLNDGEDPS